MPNRLLLQELLSKQVELIKDGDARHAKCLTQVDNFVQILKDNQVCTKDCLIIIRKGLSTNISPPRGRSLDLQSSVESWVNFPSFGIF